MTTNVLISFFCNDRPGVIEELSSVVESSRGNWLDSQLSRLGGQFAGVLQVQIPSASRDALAEALMALEAKGITTSMTNAGVAIAATKVRSLRLLGPDRPGIVHELTRTLRAAGFNVRALTTEVSTAPMSGELLFSARAEIEISEGSQMAALEEKLERLAEAMTLDIDFVDSFATNPAV
ncbi:MAG: ACT domain-containing protein [Pseudomonadota bacterium]